MAKPHPIVYSTLGAAATSSMLFHAADHLGRGVIICALAFALVRRTPRWHYLGAAVLGAGLTWIAVHFLSGGPGALLGLLFIEGSVLGIAGFWLTRSDLPAFRFFREDFLEFCGFVGLVSAFPAIFAVGIGTAADVAGRLTFELAFLGACALVPFMVLSHAIAATPFARARATPAAVTSVVESELITRDNARGERPADVSA